MEKMLLTLTAMLSFAVIVAAQQPQSLPQQFKKAFSSSSANKKVEVSGENMGLVIEGHSGNEVIIETSGYKGMPERAKGLRPLYNGGVDNTGIGLEVTEENNVISIRKASNQDLDYHIKVPAAASLSIEKAGWTNDDIEVSNVSGEIEIKSNGSDMTLKNVSGPVVANTTTGDIEIVFSSLNAQQPTSISNVSGFIDVTLPASSKATLDLSSISGDIFTDFDVQMDAKKEGLRQVGGRRVRGNINGGGVEISLKAISDNIYLRKK